MPEIRYVALCTPVPGGGCDSHGPTCPTPGKRPLVADWANSWTRERPEGNAGVLCGPEPGLLVIDVDTPEAAAQFDAWGIGALPGTFTVATGRGGVGRHYYYRWPAGLERVPNRLDGVEIKGAGRQVVAWDSLHQSGNRYEKLGGSFMDLPEAFVARLRGSTPQHSLSEVLDATPEASEALDRLLAVLPDAHELRDGNWEATCPSHLDHDPSLVVTASGDRVLVHCRAGCTAGDVVHALGLPLSALWARDPLPQKAAAPAHEKRRLGTPADIGTRFKLSDLMAATLPEKEWIVPDLLPEGLSLLAGPPKLGKSWLVLDVAISVATGRPVLGRDVPVGDVLYLALEDNEGRLQRRSRIVLGDTPAPERLELWTEAGTLTTGLVPEIEAWLDAQEAPRLVIIDTLGRVQQGSAWVDSKDGGYADAVQALSVLQKVASQRKVAVVVITHTKKGGWANGADPLEAVLGSQGYAGTADAVLVMKRERGSANGELFVTGREVDEEVTESIWFDRLTCRWVVGDADYDEGDGLTALQAKLLDVFDTKGYEWQTYEALAGLVHRRESEVKEDLEALEAAGLASKKPRPGRGRKGFLWGPWVQLPAGLAS